MRCWGSVALASEKPMPKKDMSNKSAPSTKPAWRAYVEYVNGILVSGIADTVVASLSFRSLDVFSCNQEWQRAFAEPDGPSRALRKAVELSDLTLCLDECDASSGRVERFERPKPENLVAFPPEFATVPCKPLLFDIARNQIAPPDLSGRKAKRGWGFSKAASWLGGR